MKKIIACLLVCVVYMQSGAFAGIGSKNAAWTGGTDSHFLGLNGPIEGILNTADAVSLIFSYRIGKERKYYSIPWDGFIDIEYGQKAGRRVGAAIATAVLIAPVGLFLLFSKKRKHFVTIGYRDAQGAGQAAVFELGKDIVRTTLPALKARSGKEITYQDDEARKAGR